MAALQACVTSALRATLYMGSTSAKAASRSLRSYDSEGTRGAGEGEGGRSQARELIIVGPAMLGVQCWG